MWPFFKSKNKELPTKNGDAPIPGRSPMRFAELVNSMGGFADFRDHDTAIKFWLPEAANQALEEITSRMGVSISESLRQMFASHCYGIYAYQVMVDTVPGIFREAAPPMFSRSRAEPPAGKKRIDTYWIPELGKNVMPVKVWIPKRMRQDLQLLADHVGIKFSQYLREIVIARLLGHGTLPMRPEMLKAEPLPAIEDWCEDREIPKHQIQVHDRGNHPLGEWRTEWVDE